MTPPESYAAAQTELAAILEQLQSPDVRVDDLARHVERAQELIAWCKARLRVSEEKLEGLFGDLDGE